MEEVDWWAGREGVESDGEDTERRRSRRRRSRRDRRDMGIHLSSIRTTPFIISTGIITRIEVHREVTKR